MIGPLLVFWPNGQISLYKARNTVYFICNNVFRKRCSGVFAVLLLQGESMQFHHRPPFNHGYTPLAPRSGATADMLMEFGVMVMSPGERSEDFSKTDERVWLLARGSASIFLGAEGYREVSRPNLFDYSPWCLSVPAGRRIVITAGTGGAEFYYCATDNPKSFPLKLFTPEECRSEFRGEGAPCFTFTNLMIYCHTGKESEAREVI
jgi:hypothetical protein